MTLAEPKNEKQNRALFYKLLNWGATWGGNERGKNSECKASETYLVLKFRIIKPNSR